MNKNQSEVLYAQMRQRIRDIQDKGVTYNDLAEKAKVNARWFIRFMAGIMPEPRNSDVLKVCAAIGIRVRFTMSDKLPTFIRKM